MRKKTWFHFLICTTGFVHRRADVIASLEDEREELQKRMQAVNERIDTETKGLFFEVSKVYSEEDMKEAREKYFRLYLGNHQGNS